MKRHLVVLTAVALAVSLAGCTDDDDKTTAQPPAQSTSAEPPTKPADSLPPSVNSRTETLPISATGVAPYEVGALRSDLAADGMLDAVKDAGSGCVTANGAAPFNPPSLVFTQDKLAAVRVTGGVGTSIGQSLDQVKAAYPAGSVVTGANGATGWSVPAETNTLLFEITSDKVSAVTAGVATTVTKLFTTGQGC